MRQFNSAKPRCFSSAAKIPKLATAIRESAIICDHFLVCREEVVIVPEKISESNMLSTNCESLDSNFLSGGLWGAKSVALWSRSHCVRRRFFSGLFQAVSVEDPRQFVRIKAYYVGVEAGKMLDAGIRLR